MRDNWDGVNRNRLSEAKNYDSAVDSFLIEVGIKNPSANNPLKNYADMVKGKEVYVVALKPHVVGTPPATRITDTWHAFVDMGSETMLWFTASYTSTSSRGLWGGKKVTKISKSNARTEWNNISHETAWKKTIKV